MTDFITMSHSTTVYTGSVAIESDLNANCGTKEFTMFEYIRKIQEAIPYATLGEKDNIEFIGETSDTYQLVDTILNGDGSFKYDLRTA